MTKRLKKTSKPKYKRTDIQLTSQTVQVYASPKSDEALKEVGEDLDLYKGVRLVEVMKRFSRRQQKRAAGSLCCVEKLLPIVHRASQKEKIE